MAGEEDNVGIAFAFSFAAGAATWIGAAFVFFPWLGRPLFLAASLSSAAGVMILVSFQEIMTKAHDAFVSHFAAKLGREPEDVDAEAAAASVASFFLGVALTFGLDYAVHLLLAYGERKAAAREADEGRVRAKDNNRHHRHHRRHDHSNNVDHRYNNAHEDSSRKRVAGEIGTASEFGKRSGDRNISSSSRIDDSSLNAAGAMSSPSSPSSSSSSSSANGSYHNINNNIHNIHTNNDDDHATKKNNNSNTIHNGNNNSNIGMLSVGLSSIQGDPIRQPSAHPFASIDAMSTSTSAIRPIHFGSAADAEEDDDSMTFHSVLESNMEMSSKRKDKRNGRDNKSVAFKHVDRRLSSSSGEHHTNTIHMSDNDHDHDHHGDGDSTIDASEEKRTANDVNHHMIAELEEEEQRKLKKMSLLTFIALGAHQFPEGIATFIATLSDPTAGLGLVLAVALHNLPEGSSTSVVYGHATGSKWKGFLLGIITGICEPLGAVLAYLMLKDNFTDLAFGICFGAVAGVMIKISIEELLPQAAKLDPKNKVTSTFMWIGMFVMAVSLVLFRI